MSANLGTFVVTKQAIQIDKEKEKMEGVYGTILFVLLSVTMYFHIMGMVTYPPSLHFTGRLEIARLPEEAQMELDKRIKVGTRYYATMGIFFAMFVVLMFLYPMIF